MWAKYDIWLSLGATSLRLLPYTVSPQVCIKVIFVVMGMTLLYMVGGVILQVFFMSQS